MDPTAVSPLEGGALVAIIGMVVTMLRLYLSSNKRDRGATSSMEDIKTTLADFRVKIETMWQVYVVDAMREARRTGFTAEHSAPVPTAQWEALIPLEIRKRIEHQADILVKLLDATTASHEIWVSEHKTLTRIAQESDVPVMVLIGVVQQICVSKAEEAAG